ncbi:MAG TPA: VWA domain-containing protein [Chitinophagaceae bacterium]|nr:VWA domain-containing protein [Chitinophagaceae bacterium]
MMRYTMLYEWILHTDFAYPWMFSLLALVPVLISWYRRRGDRIQGTLEVSTEHAFTARSWKNGLRHLPFLLRMAALCLLIVVLARPQKRNDDQLTEGQGIDIVLAMDVSGSMGSRDILPSRLEAAKEVAEEFVRNRPVDRIGLVIFSGESFTQCPITTDRETLLTQIESLESRRFLMDGTVIGEGLATAVDRLRESDAKSKVVILLTDGKEDPPETRLIDPLTALEIAKSQHVKVYTVGMSALNDSSQVVAENPVKGTSAQPGSSFLDEQLLRRIATETGGQYYRAIDRESLGNIYKQIDRLEKSRIEVTSFKRYEERFVPFLLTALGLLLAEAVLRYTVLRRFP